MVFGPVSCFVCLRLFCLDYVFSFLIHIFMGGVVVERLFVCFEFCCWFECVLL